MEDIPEVQSKIMTKKLLSVADIVEITGWSNQQFINSPILVTQSVQIPTLSEFQQEVWTTSSV